MSPAVAIPSGSKRALELREGLMKRYDELGRQSLGRPLIAERRVELLGVIGLLDELFVLGRHAMPREIGGLL